jgi:hypothetical protein
MIDQRGQRRQVGGDGQRQGQGQAQDERGLSGEQRGIRLLTDDGVGRAAGRVAPAAGRSHPLGLGDAEADTNAGRASEPESESAGRPAADHGRVERTRRLRCDEMHVARAVDPRTTDGRVPGPLRARIAQRHSRDTAGTVLVNPRSTETGPKTDSGDQAPLDSLAS